MIVEELERYSLLKKGFSFSNQECIVEELLTELARHQYSEEYMTLTRDYYLNM